MGQSERLVGLIDGNNVLLRSRAALGDLATSDGTPTAGVYGSIMTLLALQRDFKFSEIVWAFDWGRSLFRRSVRSSYKSNRKTEEREDAAPQFKLLHEFLDIVKIPFITIENVEADDIIASLVPKYLDPVVIVSGDHDLLQLVNENVIIAKPSVGRGSEGLVDALDVWEKYGLPPRRLAELWAIQGEPGDGIDGVPKVGPKTALKILRQHGDLCTAIRDEPKLKGYEKLVAENYRMIDLVNGSAGIDIAMNFKSEFDPSYYPQELRDYFHRLEMFSLARRFDSGKLWS